MGFSPYWVSLGLSLVSPAQVLPALSLSGFLSGLSAGYCSVHCYSLPVLRYRFCHCLPFTCHFWNVSTILPPPFLCVSAPGLGGWMLRFCTDYTLPACTRFIDSATTTCLGFCVSGWMGGLLPFLPAVLPGSCTVLHGFVLGFLPASAVIPAPYWVPPASFSGTPV